MKNYQAEDIFTPKPFPQYTYVDRNHSKQDTYEARLKHALLSDENIICILGAYRSGKTSLYRSVIPISKLIVITGAKINTEDDFWKQIATNASRSFTSAYENISTNTASTKSERVTVLSKYLLENRKMILIEDFHCINNNMQIYIMEILKSAKFKNLKSIIVSISTHKEDISKYLQFSTTTICIQPWKSTELEDIGYKGFGLLSIKVADKAISMLARDSMACPQLMQEACCKLAIYCQRELITEITEDSAQSILPQIKDMRV